jgi:AMME syndrome candidate gene 1 protein
LVKFEPAENYRDWIIGIHGIRIDFQQYGRRLSAVYLPEVAEEQGN